MNRDKHLPSPEVVDWLLDQQWSDVIPVTAITYPRGNPDGVTESERFDCCSATVAIGADECCHLQLPVEALEALRSDQQARRAATPAPAVGELSPRETEAQESFTLIRDRVLNGIEGLENDQINYVLDIIDDFTPDWV